MSDSLFFGAFLWTAYFAILEIVSRLQSKAPLCILMSEEKHPGDKAGDQTCAAFSEGIARGARFVWENATHDNVIAFGTALIAVFTYTLYRSTTKLWEGSERQLNHFERAAKRQERETAASIAAAQEANEISRSAQVASRRAWLTLEDATLAADSRFLEEGMILKTRVTAKNLGQTPATFAEINFAAHFTTTKTPYPQAVDKFKARLKQFAASRFSGQIIFPGDVYIRQLLWDVGKDDITIRTRDTDGAKFIDFMIFIGISYQIAGDSNPHITFFPYELLNVPVVYVVPTDRKLQPAPFLPGEAS
jgi:hypothetical protein